MSLEKAAVSEIVKRDYEKETYQTENLNELFGALAKAQGGFAIASKSSENSFFRSSYADITALVEASRPSLASNGLCIIQNIIHTPEGFLQLHTILGHTSGQWIKSVMRLQPVKTDIQELGKYISYTKRYSMGAIIGVVSIDEDDDGENEMREIRRRDGKNEPIKPDIGKVNSKQKSLDVLSVEQLQELEYELADYPDMAEEICRKMGVSHISQFPKSQFISIRNRIIEKKFDEKDRREHFKP